MTKFTSTGNGSEAWVFALTDHGNIYAIGLPWGGWTPNWPKLFPGPNVIDIIALDTLGPKLFAIDSNNEYWAIGIPDGGWTKNWGGDLPFKAKSFFGGDRGFLVIEAVDGSYYVNGNLGNGGSWVQADNINVPF